MVKRIFLDTNHWITLAKVALGKEKDHELVEVYQKKLRNFQILVIQYFHFPCFI